MPTIAITTSVAANARSANVLAGSVFEFMPSPGVVSFLATIPTASAVGDIEANINVGGLQIADGAVVPDTGRYPIIPDDRIAVSGAIQGERLFVTYLNTTGAAIVVTTLVEILL